MYKLLILFLFNLLSFFVSSQILNIDRENGQDSLKKKYRYSLNFSFSSDKQKKNIIDFSNTGEFDFVTNKDKVIIFVSQSEFTFNGPSVIENNGFFQLRFRDNDTRAVYPDVYTQYQWNGVQGMQRRALGGINLRFRWLEKKKSDLYTSIGSYYESEKWNPFLSAYSFYNDSLNVVNRNLYRLNFTTKFAIKIAQGVDLSGSSFLQFPLNNHFLQPRWFFDSNLNFEFNKYINFILHFDHNFDNYRPLPIDSYYYNLSLGIQIKN
jgi:hypothetical protein